MTNQRLPYLLKQYLNRQCSAQELAEFYALIDDPANDLEFADLLDDAIEHTVVDEHFDAVQQRELLQQIFEHEEIPLRSPQLKRRWNYRHFSAAAAILLIFCAGLYHFSRVEVQMPLTSMVHDIDPGGNKAVLTLANGKTINLSEAANGQLAEEGGISITKTAEGQLVYAYHEQGHATRKNNLLNSISTPRGGQYRLELPDGTRVWINAVSSLKFPLAFSGLKERRVELSGEAYFEVAKLKVPFIVVSDKQQVEVLGTHFNINAYKDEAHTKTTLLEGMVKVSSLDDKHEVTLKPGQESILNPGELTIQQADMERNTDWKNGIFIFKNESLEEIMRKVARWYDVEISYALRAPKQETFSGTVSRYDKVQKVLRRLELTGEVNFKIEGRKITVSK